jgi:hypothetical protein
MWRALVLAAALGGPLQHEPDLPAVSITCSVDAALPPADDLADLRSIGVSAITWSSHAPVPDELRRRATEAGLEVVVHDTGTVLTPESARRPAAYAVADPARVPAEALWPTVWRALAHGARVVSFVPPGGRIAGLALRNPPWLAVAGGLARQLNANGALFSVATPGPAVTWSPPNPSIDIALLDAGRVWLLVATNTSSARVRTTARLPRGTPYAMWLDLLAGTTMAMLEDAAGPRWTVTLEPGDVRVYVIDKILR